MSAPDRSREVKDIFNSNPPAPFASDEVRQEYLLSVLLPQLQKMERLGEWGFLVKTEQNGKIPGDIIVWKATMEHHFRGTAWVRLSKESFDRLSAYKARNALATWDDALEALGL